MDKKRTFAVTFSGLAHADLAFLRLKALLRHGEGSKGGESNRKSAIFVHANFDVCSLRTRCGLHKGLSLCAVLFFLMILIIIKKRINERTSRRAGERGQEQG